MNLVINSNYILATVLVSIRFSSIFLLTPIFAAAKIPGKFQAIFLLGLSWLLVSGLNISIATDSFSVAALFGMALTEFIIGGMMSFGIFAAFAAFVFGGRILDFQMGFGVANLIDPVTSAQSPLLGTFLNLTAVLSFFLLDGHHMILRGLAYSLERIPPGSFLNELDLSAILAQFGVMFIYGIAVVAPAIFALLLLDVGMAVAARTMPQVNMFIVSMPLKIFIGLLVVAISLNYMAPLLEKVYSSIFIYWERLLN